MIIIPGRGIVPQKAVPQTRHFPDFLAAYREYTKGHEATAKVHMWTAISCIAAALERKVWLERDYYKIFPNLYVFIVGQPGLVRKTTSSGIGVELLREIPTIKLMPERVTSASLIERISESGDSFFHQGGEIRHSSIFSYSGELTVLMNENANDIIDLLITFYDCQPNDSTKPWVYTTRAYGEAKVYGPCLNMLGCTTPVALQKAIPSQQMEGGFASRVLFVIERDLPDVFVPRPKIPPGYETFKQKLIEDLSVINSLAGEFKMTTETEVMFDGWYTTHMHQIKERGPNAKLSGYYGRKATQVEKLAMVASVSESNSLVIESRHLVKAIAWIERLEKPMMDNFAVSGQNRLADSTIRVLRAIQESGSMSLSDLSVRFFNDLDSFEMKKVLEQLSQMNAVLLQMRGSQMEYVLNPNCEFLKDGQAT